MIVKAFGIINIFFPTTICLRIEIMPGSMISFMKIGSFVILILSFLIQGLICVKINEEIILQRVITILFSYIKILLLMAILIMNLVTCPAKEWFKK